MHGSQFKANSKGRPEKVHTGILYNNLQHWNKKDSRLTLLESVTVSTWSEMCGSGAEQF